jgi:hypothetical protein
MDVRSTILEICAPFSNIEHAYYTITLHLCQWAVNSDEETRFTHKNRIALHCCHWTLTYPLRSTWVTGAPSVACSVYYRCYLQPNKTGSVDLLYEQRNMEALLCNHPAWRAHAPYCHVCPVLVYHIFSNYPINGTIFGEKVI